MNKLSELINKLCPNGVEYKPLEKCCNILDNMRKPITKSARKKVIIHIMVQMAFKIMFQIIFLMGSLYLLEKMEVL